MMTMMMDFMSHMTQMPMWVQVWLAWMMMVNMASLAFLRRIEARVVLGAFVTIMMLMPALFMLNGFNRLLGLTHVLVWTPLLIYLVRRHAEIEGKGYFSVWVKGLVLTNGLSLIIDYTDVARYLMGDRS